MANGSAAHTAVSAPPASPAVAIKAGGPASEQLEAFLINFVVEQTGYPAEVVDLDADLEADLGIDSIKKAQLFGELQEYFDIAEPATRQGTFRSTTSPRYGTSLNFLSNARPRPDSRRSPRPATSRPPVGGIAEPGNRHPGNRSFRLAADRTG